MTTHAITHAPTSVRMYSVEDHTIQKGYHQLWTFKRGRD